MNRPRAIILVSFLILLGLLFCQCGVLKSESNQNGEYSIFGNGGELKTVYKHNASGFKRDEKLLVITSKVIGTNQKGIFFDYKFQIDERCQNYVRKDSVKYNVTKVSKKTFNIDGEDHSLYKFYYDEHASWDEEDLIIVHEDLGIIFIHRYWGDRIELEKHPKFSQEKLKTLKKLIKGDQTFYKAWDSCIWN